MTTRTLSLPLQLESALNKLPSSILCGHGAEKSTWPHLMVLFLVGLMAFFYNLNLSFLEGSEGLYPQITREMVAAKEFVHLTWQGETYSNKPPLFFWLLAISREVFGETEWAFRFPGALFALGTVGLTYLLGRTMFSPTAAWWAALIVATSHVFLWYGRRVLFDSTLTFAMTLALFAWVRAYMQSATSFWYVIAFLAMAFGTMVKSIHAFAMPFALMMAYSCLQRDFRAFKAPWFWIGLCLYGGVTGWYASMIGNQFSWQFNLHDLLGRAFDFSNSTGSGSNRGRPFFWYLGVMWFDFFPWSALLPSSLILLYSQRAFWNNPKGQFLVLWVLGYLLLLSTSTLKREPYLMPIVPGLGLMIGYYYHQICSGYEEQPWVENVTKVMLGLLGIAFVGAMFVGPILLQRKWHSPISYFPFWYTFPMNGLCVALLWSVFKARMDMALATVGLLSIGFVIGVVNVVFPILDQSWTPKNVDREVRTSANNMEKPLVQYGLVQGDLIFYLNDPPAIPRIRSEKELQTLIEPNQEVLVVTDKRTFERMTQNANLALRTIREFLQPNKKHFYLLSVRADSNSIQPDIDG